jgi:hypothetical protein
MERGEEGGRARDGREAVGVRGGHCRVVVGAGRERAEEERGEKEEEEKGEERSR